LKCIIAAEDVSSGNSLTGDNEAATTTRFPCKRLEFLVEFETGCPSRLGTETSKHKKAITAAGRRQLRQVLHHTIAPFLTGTRTGIQHQPIRQTTVYLPFARMMRNRSYRQGVLLSVFPALFTRRPSARNTAAPLHNCSLSGKS
jgi:hypothetical protein